VLAIEAQFFTSIHRPLPGECQKKKVEFISVPLKKLKVLIFNFKRVKAIP
jgi:hypothetical protein